VTSLATTQRTEALDRLAQVIPALRSTVAEVAAGLDAALIARLHGAVTRMATTVAAVRSDHRRGLGPALYAMGGLSTVADEVLWALELAGRSDEGAALGLAVAKVAGPLTDLATLAMGLVVSHEV
jgi:hypothetical protein